MTRTITVRGRTYTVEDEPRLNGEIAPHIYDSLSETVGVLHEDAGGSVIIGAPKGWTRSDIRSAIEQVLAGS